MVSGHSCQEGLSGKASLKVEGELLGAPFEFEFVGDDLAEIMVSGKTRPIWTSCSLTGSGVGKFAVIAAAIVGETVSTPVHRRPSSREGSTAG
jgi:hypothetical protein